MPRRLLAVPSANVPHAALCCVLCVGHTQAWVLDTVPAEVPTGAGGGPAGAALDHPRALIEALRDIPEPIETRNQVLDTLLQQGMHQLRQPAAAAQRRSQQTTPVAD